MSAKVTQYKYNLKLKLEKLNPTEKLIAKSEIYKQCGIVYVSLSIWANIKKEEPKDIPAMALVKIAKILNCSVEELVNN